MALLVAAATCAAAGACAGETREVEVTAEERGEALFADPTLGREGNAVACSDCHDVEGIVGGTGKPGAPLTGVTARDTFWAGKEQDLLGAVNQCLFWFMGRTDRMERDDARGVDLYAYLASLEGDAAATAPQPFTLGDVAWPGTGDAARGADVYARSCALCHGALHTREGALVSAAPALPDTTITAHPPDEYTADQLRLVFVEKIRHGPFLGYGGTMPPFSIEVIPDGALADLVTYLEVP
jgi:thiosulfate dehydrogenase